jgi:FkbM family methyltransferase
MPSGEKSDSPRARTRKGGSASFAIGGKTARANHIPLGRGSADDSISKVCSSNDRNFRLWVVRDMSKRWNMRHSPIGWVARKAVRLIYRAKHPSNAPVTYQLPGPTQIRLYPEGEIAEFLSFPRLFERHELKLVATFLKPGMRVVDVGANIGLYSILGASRVGDAGRVWAFEPSRESYDRLLRNLELNRCGCVQPIQAALGDAPNRSSTLLSDAGYGDAYRYLSPASEHESRGASGEVVRETTLDACAAEYGINRIDFIKIDVEGGEYRVLLGAKETLSANQNVRVVFESEADWCERAGCRQQDAFELLRSAGFRLYAWDRAKKNWTSDERELLRAGMVWASRSGVPIAVSA